MSMPDSTNSKSTSHQGLETQILFRLLSAQNRWRLIKATEKGCLWFAGGSVLSSLCIALLWHWHRLPGPWQWLASAGRPIELLWMPVLFALGGFISGWTTKPSLTRMAHLLDRQKDTGETLLTAADWILSTEPRSRASQAVLAQAWASLESNFDFRRDLKKAVTFKPWVDVYLLTLILPLGLLFALLTQSGLPPTAYQFIGQEQVERLHEELLQSPALAPSEQALAERLHDLLRDLDQESGSLERETIESLLKAAESQKSLDQASRRLLETLAERAASGIEISQQDLDALKSISERQPQLSELVEEALQDWQSGRAEEAAKKLQQAQESAGQSARATREAAGRVSEAWQSEQGEQGANPDGQGTQYDSNQGDAFGEQGSGNQSGPGAGSDNGDEEGEGSADFGMGTTDRDEGEEGGTLGQQSLRRSNRTSDWEEEFRNLHPPDRREQDTSQTRVQGEIDESGRTRSTPQTGLGGAQVAPESALSGGILEYRQATENALLREELPPEHADAVRRYFENLDQR